MVRNKLEEIKFIWAHRAKERVDILGRKEPTITISQAHEDLEMVFELFKDSVVLSREEYQKDFSNQFNKGYKYGSKETAEKILKWLKDLNIIACFSIIEKHFKEQFGVEIKE